MNSSNVIPIETFNAHKQRGIQAGTFTQPAQRRAACGLSTSWASESRQPQILPAESIQHFAHQLARKMTVFSDWPRDSA
jgi:hypothetical protein